MSTTASTVHKKCAKNTMMHCAFVEKRCIRKKKTIGLIIMNLSKVNEKKNVAHSLHVEQLDWGLKLIRKKGQALQLEIHIKSFDNTISCYLRYGNERRRDEARLYDDGKYRIIFPNFDWQVSKDIPLLLSFTYDRFKVHSKPVLLCYGERTIHNRSTLGKELFKMYERQFLTDFVISVPGKEFRVHKAILASRFDDFSRYTYELDENGEGKIRSSASEEVMEEVIRFFYTSEILVRNLEDVISIFKLAAELNVSCLRNWCVHKLQHILVKENARQIRKVAKNLGEDILVEMADAFLKGKQLTRRTTGQ